MTWPPTRWAVKSLLKVLQRPRLWRYTLRFIVWRPYPHIPKKYLWFRLSTMYGTDGRGYTDTGDLVRYLEWIARIERRIRLEKKDAHSAHA